MGDLRITHTFAWTQHPLRRSLVLHSSIACESLLKTFCMNVPKWSFTVAPRTSGSRFVEAGVFVKMRVVSWKSHLSSLLLFFIIIIIIMVSMQHTTYSL